MKAYLVAGVPWLVAAYVAYANGPVLLHRVTAGWQRYQVENLFIWSALTLGFTVAVAILATMALYGRPRR